jgi:hypothetical protein
MKRTTVIVLGYFSTTDFGRHISGTPGEEIELTHPTAARLYRTGLVKYKSRKVKAILEVTEPPLDLEIKEQGEESNG